MSEDITLPLELQRESHGHYPDLPSEIKGKKA